MDYKEIFKLPKPNLNKDDLIGYNVGIRPYRKGGVRIGVEEREGKMIVHNYGHGGGGVSLVFGACEKAMRKFWSHTAKFGKVPETVDVIGAG